mmetsp:Transcript_31972/g.61799  ORF Transcript_31972/g.61799 Transcript_31972/m.61799 type:complete len:411 (-) Transcript_31972:46-1278(-)
MSTQKPEPESNAEEVPPEFECTICMKLLLDPVTVSCGHTFCKQCLEQALDYRNLCAVCRAPVAPGPGVNVLLRSIIAERFPRACAERREEQQAELQAGEQEADDERHREALGPTPAGNRASHDESMTLPLATLSELSGAVLPHCMMEADLIEGRLLDYALQGARRLAVLVGAAETPHSGEGEALQAVGVCFSIEEFHRPPPPRVLHLALQGMFRFRLLEPPQWHQDGFEICRCTVFFDVPLQIAELTRPGNTGEEQPHAQQGHITATQLAGETMELLEHQLVQVGHSGRRMFNMKFGETPAMQRRAITSASLERISFWLLGTLVPDDATEHRRWIRSTDTRARLEHCRAKLAAAGSRPVLDLPGARSWMHPGQSALGSFGLLLALLVLLLAKNWGLFEGGGHNYGQYDWD